MKTKYNPELIIGKKEIGLFQELKISDLFDYHKAPVQGASSYFTKSNKSEYYGDLDIRGSSAQWNDDISSSNLNNPSIPRDFIKRESNIVSNFSNRTNLDASNLFKSKINFNKSEHAGNNKFE